MVHDGELPVSLLDLDVCGRRLHAEGVVVRRVDDHVGGLWMHTDRVESAGR